MSCIKRLLRVVAISLAVLCLVAAGARGAEKPQSPPKFVPGSWTMVLLPDTQIYAENYPGSVHHANALDRQESRTGTTSATRSTLGDITNQDTDIQWQHAARGDYGNGRQSPLRAGARQPRLYAARRRGFRPLGLEQVFFARPVSRLADVRRRDAPERHHQQLSLVPRRRDRLDHHRSGMVPAQRDSAMGQRGPGQISPAESHSRHPRLSL